MTCAEKYNTTKFPLGGKEKPHSFIFKSAYISLSTTALRMF